MKKIIKLGIFATFAISLCFCFVACSDLGNIVNPEPTKDAIKAESLELTSGMSVIEGESCMAVNYNNTTNYTILTVVLNYDFKQGVTDAQITQAFNKIDNKWLTLDKVKKWDKKAELEIPTKPGNKSSDSPISYAVSMLSGYAIDSQAQLDLLEPSKLNIIYKANNNKIYNETYDYKNDAYGLSSNVIDANFWPENDLGNAIPKPTYEYTVCQSNSDNSLSTYVLGIELSDFEDYKAKCKEAGLSNVKTDSSTTYYKNFTSESVDGKYKVSLSYNIRTKKMEITGNAK